MTDAFLYAATRTPFGRFGGALADVRPDDLGAAAVSAVLAKAPDLDPERIGDVVWGCANQAGEDNRNVGRMAVLLAGLPVSVPAVTVNRLCGSSLDAAMTGSRIVESGDADVVLVGGVESMTRAPWVLPKPSRAYPAGNVTAVSTTLGWRLVNDRMPTEWTVSLGEANEVLAERFGISRERQDEFAVRSHTLAHAAWESGFYDDLVAPVPAPTSPATRASGPDSTRREARRAEAVVPPGRHHHRRQRLAAQRRRLRAAARLGVRGRPSGGSTRSRGSPAGAPTRWRRRTSASRPSRPPRRRWPAPGIGWADVAAVELNEAFAAQSLACVDAVERIDPEIVNAKGGAIAIGHPLGASGGRILGTLAHRLRESGDRWGVAAICIGVGQALAVVLENPACS